MKTRYTTALLFAVSLGACHADALEVSSYQTPVLTAEEFAMSGDLIHYWPNQDAVDNNRPAIMMVQRAAIGSPTMIHGRIYGAAGSADTFRGDPTELGFNPGGSPAIELAGSPEVGKATLREFSLSSLADDIDTLVETLADIDERVEAVEDVAFAPAWGEVILTGGSGLSLSSSWTTLTGGTASTAGSGVSYDSGTGVLTIPAGTYRIDFSATQARTLGLTAPDLDVAVFMDGVQTNAIGSHTLAAIADTRTVTGYTTVTVTASASVTLRTRSDLSLQIVTSRFQFSARRVE